MARARRRRRRGAELDLPAKANRVLSIIFTVLCLIFLRIWQLAVVQHDAMLESALRPQVKCVTERAERGTICDRFGLPLALNKVQYNASVCYAHIRSVPAIEWQLDANGKRQKIYRRRAYITELSQVLGQELGLPADRLEDLIYSKAALYQHVPYLLREDIHEESYYRLKMLEREWPGIVAERCPKRYYPHGRVASDVIGYMGAINRGEYEAVMAEVAELDAWLASVELGETPPFPASLESITEVEARLHDLRERAYGINDYLGKA
ncbi:MAG: hypothetical protein KDK78_11780, partial [Chlamydiia bacterium]|nr:hypothetical protein [Chlamydiia bacterium]